MTKVVIMERSDQAGAFQKVLRTAETESDSFGAWDLVRCMKNCARSMTMPSRAYPGLEADEAFAMAWHGLSLSDRAQIRDEETGEWQAATSRSRAAIANHLMRAAGRDEGKHHHEA